MKHKNLHVIQGIDFQRIEAAQKCLGKPKVFRALPGGDFVGKKKFYDCWRYDSLQFEGGNIYALVGEFGEGCMYLSYLLGGKVDFGDLKIYINGSEIKKQDLKLISWNLEPMEERYGNLVVKKV